MSEDRCVCCGEIIPDGRMVCPVCAGDVESGEPFQMPAVNRLEDVSGILKAWSRYFRLSHKHRMYDPAFTKLNKLFPSIAERMSNVIDSAITEGEQISMSDMHIGKN